jgi:hypothetical protein
MKKCIFTNLKKRWINHLKENNMNYIEHMIFALYYGLLCLSAGLYLIIHSILPCFFPTTGSDLVNKLSKRFNKQR